MNRELDRSDGHHGSEKQSRSGLAEEVAVDIGIDVQRSLGWWSRP
jgi:hypothetical protein